MSGLRFPGGSAPRASHYFAALAFWIGVLVAASVLLRGTSETAAGFTAMLGAVTLLLRRPEGIRGWLAALAAALLVSATALCGILFARWSGEFLQISNEGVPALLQLPAAVPAILLSFHLGWARRRRATEADGQLAGGTGGGFRTPQLLGIAGISGVSAATAFDLVEQYQRIVLSLAGYDADRFEIDPFLGVMMLISGLWLAANWKVRPARNAILAATLAFTAAAPVATLAGPWFAASLTPDPGRFMELFAPSIPGLMLMVVWLAVLFGLQHIYRLNRDPDEVENPAEESRA